MTPLRSEYGVGYAAAAPSENYLMVGSLRSWQGKNPPLVYCHGSGGSAATAFNMYYPGQIALLTALAQRYMVIAPDLGLEAWGNNNHVARIGDAITYLRNRFGYATSQKITLVAGSMGTLGAIRYARLNPTAVTAVAAVIPALDLADLMTRGAATAINAAYGGSYDDATMGATYSPAKYASVMNASVPIHLFTASNDSICVPATASSFVTARPSTLRTNIGATDHSEASITAAVGPLTNWLLTGV